MASLIKRGDFWYIKMYDHTGKQLMRKAYTDKRESQSLANQLEDEKTKMKRGDIDPKHEQRKVERAKEITSHLAEYKVLLQAKGNTADHVRSAIADIQKFIDFKKVTHADSITRAMVDAWVVELKKSIEPKPDEPKTAGEKKTAAVGDSNRTINRRVGALKSFLKHLHSIGTISEYLLYKYPKLATKGFERRLARVLDVGEQAKLLLSASPDRVDLYRFCLGTGARHSAGAALTVKDVNFAENTLALKSKDSSNQSNVYVIPIHPGLLPTLKKLCAGKDRDDNVFYVPVRSMASRLLRQDCKTAGVDTKKVMFHGLRHSFITTLAKANIHPNVVQALAGHKNIAVTLEYYTHFKRSDERSALEVLAL